ncbi:MAG TPA: beta-L-arabinofuranosidase domain-containing protein [Prolixibacteraceae bacterium]|nr:beta-L-arabinofuranosidase domain-containing protein [Prolixibacteraceae bacterium]
MKTLIIALVFILLVPCILGAQPKSVVLKQDVLHPWESSNIQIKGYLGEKIDLCIGERIKKQDIQMLIDPFKQRNETHLWQTEFWGKWILSAIASWEYTRDPEMLAIIRNAVTGLLATQTPDGYIGNYSPQAQLAHWDIWGRKYTLLGLLAYYDISNDNKALEASRKLADHLMTQVGEGKADIVKTGNYHGMPSSSILEPIVLLYRHTGEKRYLDFARYIVGQWETASGPRLLSKSKEGVDVADRFPFPKEWWSWDNGQKAYEMMSCYEGLLELYRITGEADYLKSAEMAVQNIIDTEINVAGSGTAFECFYHGAQRQTEPTYHTMETCVTFTWIKLCNNLLRLTGNPMYADQIEKTIYNALMASMKEDGSQIAKYSPLEGRRHEGEQQCNMPINCCNANGPRAFTLIPRMAYMSSGNEIVVNLYSASKASIAVSPKNKVVIEQTTDYPVTDRIELTLQPERPEAFTLALRIPAWSAKSSITVNGIPVENITSGSYSRITRTWAKGDKVSLQLDLSAHIVTLNGFQAIMRGPVLLARDSRFNDGFVDEAAVVQHKDQIVELQASRDKPKDIWMAFTAPLVLGTDLEGEFRNAHPVHFCDFGSAGNTWSPEVRYRVWIKQTLNVMNAPYKAY